MVKVKGRIEDRVLTDSELVKQVLGSSPQDKPLVFYRSIPRDQAVNGIIRRSSFVLRPFSYTKPGTKGDIPLSYGLSDPVLFRILDPHGEWEDTGYFLGTSQGRWNEAINLDPVRLKKLSAGRFKASDLYRQVGRDNVGDDTEVWQGTYSVDKLSPSAKLELLGELREDPGFLGELRQRVKYFSPATSNPHRGRLNEKYLTYFDWARSIPPSDIKDEKTRMLLQKLHGEIDTLRHKLTKR